MAKRWTPNRCFSRIRREGIMQQASWWRHHGHSKENLSFQQQAYNIFESEDNLNRRVAEILKDYNCIKNIELQASAGDLNYEELTEDEVYPASEINDYLNKRIYLPNFEDET